MSEVPSAVQRMIDATNAGDHDAFVAAFHPSGVIVDWGKQFHGSEQIAGWDESDNIGRGSRFTVTGVAQDGAEVVVTIAVSGQGFNGTSDFGFIVVDDLIERMEIRP